MSRFISQVTRFFPWFGDLGFGLRGSTDLRLTCPPAFALLLVVLFWGGEGEVAGQVPQAPVITSSASSSVVTAGTEVVLSVTTTTPAQSYRWTHNRVLIPGATESTLRLPNIQVAQAGRYDVSVQIDSRTWVGSMPEYIAVVGSTPIAGDRVWVVPADSEASGGVDWALFVEVMASAINQVGPLPIQWFKDGVALPGKTEQTLWLNNVSRADAGRYHAVVAGHESSPAVFRVDQTPPAFDHHPQSTWSSIGGSASFSYSLVPYAHPVSNQWYRNGTAIPGATNGYLAIHPVKEADYGAYTVRVTSNAGSVESQPARLDPPLFPVIVQQPTAQVVKVGERLSLSVVATGDAAILPLSYQWMKDGVLIAGATQPAYNVEQVGEADAGHYSVRVTGSRGDVDSIRVPVTVGFTVPEEGKPVFLAQPADIEVQEGKTARLEVIGGGRPPYAYQWFKGGQPVTGATESALVLSSVKKEDAGAYAVTLTNPVGSITSRTATLVVKPASDDSAAPRIVQQPKSVLATPGSTVEFTVEVVGVSPVSITWLHNGLPITSMAASKTLTIENVQSSHAGSYQVHVSTPAGSVHSEAATLTLVAPPEIVRQPIGTEVIEGGNLVLQVAATGAPAPTLQWYRDGQPIPGAVDATYFLSNAPLSAAGTYWIRVTNPHGSVDSAAVQVVVRRAAKHAGIYFGRFGTDGSGGEFAVVVRTDGTCNLIGYLSASSLGFTANFPISSDGSFNISENLIRMFGSLSGPNEATRRSASSGITGQIAGQSMSGSWPAMKQTLSGQRNADSGPASSMAGYYAAGVVNSADVTYSVVGADGRLLVLRTNAAGATGSSGAVSAGGEFVIDQSDGTKLIGRIDADTRTLTGTAVAATGDSSDFAGGENSALRNDRLINISTRGWVGADADQLIAGFVIQGSAPRTVLIRAVGPTLGQFDVPGTLSEPKLTLIHDGATLATAGAWSGSVASETARRAGAFPLPAGSADSVMVQTLKPGLYSVLVSPENSQRGVALVEVYDASEGDGPAAPARLINISTRGFVGTGDQVLIAGFAIVGANPKTVLIRGVGPSLAQFIGGVLSDPMLTVQSGQAEIARNDGWAGDGRIAGVARDVGAFALEPSLKDAALLLTLKPGNYTALLRSKSGGTGRALIEVYEVNP
jgi:hypothetical protein